MQDKWQVSRKLTVSTYGLRWEYFAPPVGDMQQYNATTNTMTVCGSSANSSGDCGTKFSKRLFAPRLGVAYRPSEGFVIRAGFGISYDPFFIGQQILRIYPNQISYSLTGTNTFQPVSTLAQGIPALTFPAIGNGVLAMPSAISLNSLGSSYTRSYTMSWNVMLRSNSNYPGFRGSGWLRGQSRSSSAIRNQRQCRRSHRSRNREGEPLNGLFGRTATTNYFEPFGHSHYDALQATLNRLFSPPAT